MIAIKRRLRVGSASAYEIVPAKGISRPLKRTLRAIVLLLAIAPLGSAGTVVTKDGKTIEGEMAINDTGALTVAPKGGAATTVEVKNLKRATFVPDVPLTAPGAWKHQDIGKVHAPGSAAEVKSDGASVYRLNGSGWGFWGAKDSGHLLAWPVEGDGQIIAHVNVKAENGVIAGVLFRDSMSPDAPMATTSIYAGGEVRFVRRPVEGWIGGPEGKVVAVREEWLRLARNGAEVSSYKSKDGKYWTLVGHQKVPLAEKGLACLTVASTTNAYNAAAEFDHVQVIPGPSSGSYFANGTGPAGGVVMVDGTMLCGMVQTVENGKVQVLPTFGPDGAPVRYDEQKPDWNALEKVWLKLPVESVARVRMNPEPPDVEKVLNGGSSGVLLTSGDFIEAEIQRLTYRRYLDINSVLFGAKRMDAPTECLSLVLHETKPVAGAFEVCAKDGSIIQARGVGLSKKFVEIDSGTLGKLKLPVGEIKSIEAR